MFEIGSVVSYGSTGVCKVSGEMQQKVKGEMKKYLVLKPVYKNNSTVYVPVDNENLMSKLKPVLTKADAEDIIEAMSEERAEWIKSDSERIRYFRETLSDGNIKSIAIMVRTLYKHRKSQFAKGRKLHASDEYFFKDAEELLFDELAMALEIRPEEVGAYLNERLAN
ncbi:CarD family transcriptional regulator [uncultured Ruminococcus sp.]|uniref:CarD family transcriptional regulator n=1 Tax=uncultured Ruminococcus sp. TaxID=165186 RepID=UPI0025E92569|nr:CarD family transcriptional regulator [uncultured Ruminococcus sp.]